MITFIVTADLIMNARLLDSKRLGKQRIEALQILKAIEMGTGWVHHPMTKAWRPYPMALKYYTNCIIKEFIRRGGHNTLSLFELPEMIIFPWWLSWERLHQSHRMMLFRKNPDFYGNQFSIDPSYSAYGYIWPHLISYDQREAPLEEITAPIPKELVNPVYCEAQIKTGKRKGQVCHGLVKDKHMYCKIHRVSMKSLAGIRNT
jgi:hypothetical protein